MVIHLRKEQNNIFFQQKIKSLIRFKTKLAVIMKI